MAADRPVTPTNERSLDQLDDLELLNCHREGSTDAFGELVRRHQDRMWAVALRTSGDHAEAQDALQDALLSAYRVANRFRGESAVSTWLHRIVVNACLDRLRRRASRPTVALVDPLPDASGGVGVSTAALVAPVDEFARHDARLDVMAALATLVPEQRVALVLVDMEGWSVAEVAAHLGVAEGTVKSRCARGRARLLPLLQVNQGTGTPSDASKERS